MKKIAQDPQSIVTGLFEQIYDPEDKVGSLSKFFGPAVVTKLMHLMGFGFYGNLVGILLSAFGVDIAGILKSIVSAISPGIEAGKEFSVDEIKSKVESAFDAGFASSKSASMTFDQIIKTAKYNDKPGVLSSLINDIMGNDEFKKKWSHSLSDGSNSVFKKVFTSIFVILLSSMGSLVAGQGIKKMLGKPNVFDGTATPISKSKPLKYEMKQSASKDIKSNWIVPIKNTSQEVSKFLISCVRNSFEVDSLSDNEIKRSKAFDEIENDILLYNNRVSFDKGIKIPSEYKNELTISYPIIKDLS